MTYKIIQADNIPATGLVIQGNYNFFRYLEGVADKIFVRIVQPVSEGGEVILRPNQGIQVPHWREIHVFLVNPYVSCYGFSESCKPIEQLAREDGDYCDTYNPIGGSGSTSCNNWNGTDPGENSWGCDENGKRFDGTDGPCCDGYDPLGCPPGTVNPNKSVARNNRNISYKNSSAFTFLLSDCDIVSDVGGSAGGGTSDVVEVSNFPAVQSVSSEVFSSGTLLLVVDGNSSVSDYVIDANPNRKSILLHNYYSDSNANPAVTVEVKLLNPDDSVIMFERFIGNERASIPWAGKIVVTLVSALKPSQVFTVTEFV